MGQAKNSIVKAYNEEYLHYYLQRNEFQNIEILLQKRPELIESTLTHKSKMTPLYRACYKGNLKMVQFLVEKYNANINRVTENGQTALMAAVKRNHLNIVRYLLGKGADVNVVSKIGLSTLQFAILPGFYQIALPIYEKIQDKRIKPIKQFQEWAQLYSYRYVNYSVFLQFLEKMIDAHNVTDYLTRPKIVLKDPVADPRETWKEWFKRQMEFKDPPLVQRNDLPEELQPQNLKFGKLKSFLSNMARSPMVPKSDFLPRYSSSVMAPHTENQLKKTEVQNSQQMQIQSVP